jgi:chromate reductase
MITILSATNRPNSNSLKIARHYLQLLEKQGVEAKLFSFEQLPHDIAFSEMFSKRTSAFQSILDEYIVPTQKIVIVAPEYNGSFPGILKIFIDATHPDLLRGKKTGLIGVSSGRAGNLRGLDHLTGILHHIGVFVHPNKLPVSSVPTLLDQNGNVADENTIKALEKHATGLIAY